MKRPIFKFLYKTLAFTIPVLMLFILLYWLGFEPVVTDSAFFDRKMRVVQKRHLKNVNVLAIGSSVTLYELNSTIMIQNIHLSYYNFGSWGLQMTDVKPMLNSYVKKYDPKYVIICSTLADFVKAQNASYFNYLDADDLIKDDFPELFYFINYNSIHQVVRRKLNLYPVNIDNWGGVALQVKQQPAINEAVHSAFPSKYTAGNYKALDSIGTFLSAQNIKLIFIQVPIKKSYANTPVLQQGLTAHFNNCKSIVEGRGGIYLNYYNTTIFTDSLFVDQYHLRDIGSVVLTREVVADLKKIIPDR